MARLFYQQVKLNIILLLILLVSSSCGGENKKPNDIATPGDTTHTIKAVGHHTYEKILKNAGVLDIFKLDTVDEYQGTVRIPLYPRLDRKAGMLMKKNTLLNQFNHQLALKISTKTGLPVDNIILLIKMSNCKIKLTHKNNKPRNNSDECDRGVVELNEPQKHLIKNISTLLRCWLTGGCNVATVLSKDTFITEQHLAKFCQSEFKTNTCKVIQDASSKMIYHLTNIKVSGYVTTNSCENLSIKIKLFPTELGKTTYADLKLSGKYGGGLKIVSCSSSSEYPKSLRKNLPERLENKEEELDREFKKFINIEAKK
jgi:hypothetical protein